MTNATPTLLYIDDDEALARLVDRGLTRHRSQGGACRRRPGGPRAARARRHRRGRARSVHARPRRAGDAGAAPENPGRAAGGVRHGVAGFGDRRHRAEGRRRRLSGQGHPRRFHPPAPGRGQRRAAAGRAAKAPATRPRPKSTPRATVLRRSPPSARCCCARSTTASATRLQIIASLLASAGQFQRPRKTSRRRSPTRWAASLRSHRSTAGSTPRMT